MRLTKQKPFVVFRKQKRRMFVLGKDGRGKRIFFFQQWSFYGEMFNMAQN